MPVILDEEVARVHVMLFSEDVAQLKALFGDSVGVSKAVRLMIRQYLRKFQEKMRQKEA